MPPAGSYSTGVNRSPEVGDGGGGRWIWTDKRERKTADVFWRTATMMAKDEQRCCDGDDRGWLSN